MLISDQLHNITLRKDYNSIKDKLISNKTINLLNNLNKNNRI